MTAIIETDRLTKRYGRARGIEDVDLQVRAGEVFGFLGPNGAGKTTTIRTLLDLQHPTSGSARVFGLDSQRDSLAIRARLGNLPGEFAAPPHATGRELLSHFARLRGIDGLGGAQVLAERFEADLGRPLAELSKGNRQKIGIIQALFHDPELLIVDEPTTGLDPLMQEEFLEVVRDHRDRGGTVFLSSHDLDEVQRVCDRVGIIRGGRLIAVESVDDLRTRADRNVTVRLGAPVDRAALAAVPGVAKFDADGDGTRVHFRVSGPLDPVIAYLAHREVLDLEVTRPSLDELFLTYYDREARS